MFCYCLLCLFACCLNLLYFVFNLLLMFWCWTLVLVFVLYYFFCFLMFIVLMVVWDVLLTLDYLDFVVCFNAFDLVAACWLMSLLVVWFCCGVGCFVILWVFCGCNFVLEFSFLVFCVLDVGVVESGFG